MSEITRSDFNQLEERVKILESGKNTRAKRTSKIKRAPSEYNLYMKVALPKVKKKNPSLDHRAAFTEAARGWSKHKK